VSKGKVMRYSKFKTILLVLEGYTEKILLLPVCPKIA
jgi:hypothetical protein